MGWLSYENQKWGYRLSYPGRWQIIEAKVAQEKKGAWSGDVLFDGELRKVTFGEPGNNMWPGGFQVIVLCNPKKWTLREWLMHYEIRDVSGGDLIQEVEETSLGDRPARLLKIFMFDHQGLEIIASHRGLIYKLIFAGNNPNDPEAPKHKLIYRQMVSSFRFLRER